MEDTIINISSGTSEKGKTNVNGQCVIMCDELICNNSYIYAPADKEGYIAIYSQKANHNQYPTMQIQPEIYIGYKNMRLDHIEAESLQEIIRYSWKAGSRCQVYSRTYQEWFDGKIESIYMKETDGEYAEWFKVRYNGRSKDIQRLCKFIRPSTIKPTQMIMKQARWHHIRAICDNWQQYIDGDDAEIAAEHSRRTDTMLW